MKKLILATITLVAATGIHAQGCSDAGVCTLHSIKDNTSAGAASSGHSNKVATGIAYGVGERSTDNYTAYVEYTRTLSKTTSLTGKFNYGFIRGELASTSGPGDLFLSVSHVFSKQSRWEKSFVAGIKLPLGPADQQKNGIRLPMPYQTSLGTVDIVAGINFSRKNFGATLAYQQPLKSRNNNGFLPGDYPEEPLTLQYWPTNQFIRKGDIVGRVAYNIKAGSGFSIRPGLLGIYHLGNDTYLDKMNNRKPVYNSAGLTLNGTLFFTYRMKNGNGFELMAGTPFVVRDQRPDGLTRKFVTGIEYQFSF